MEEEGGQASLRNMFLLPKSDTGMKFVASILIGVYCGTMLEPLAA